MDRSLISITYKDTRDNSSVLRIFREDNETILMTNEGLMHITNCQVRTHNSLWITVKEFSDKLILATYITFFAPTFVVDREDFELIKHYLLYEWA